MPVPNLDALLVSRIATHLKSHHLAICMFENALAHANDPWLYQSKVHTLICGQDVYHFLTNEDDPNLIQLTVKKARSIEPPLVGVLSESSSPPSFPDGRIKLSDLRRIAERTEQLLVGAYDGEGFLVWHK
jgi:hypothetical protein